MIGPYQLTHIVYVLLVVAFVSVIGYMLYHNRRSRKLQRKLEDHGKTFASTEEGILEAQNASGEEQGKRAA
jgi:Tfp pilus assembly protein PilO